MSRSQRILDLLKDGKEEDNLEDDLESIGKSNYVQYYSFILALQTT